MGKIKNYINKVKYAKNTIPGCSIFLAIKIPFDCSLWQRRYHLLASEYYFYEFFRKNKKQRLEYVRDIECMQDIPNKFNNSEEYKILENKNAFNVLFQEQIGREYIYVDAASSYEEFTSFVSKNPTFMYKPISNLGGFGIEKMSVTKDDVEQVWNDIVSRGECLLEEVLVQHEKMAALNPDTINTVRVVSMVNDKGEINIPIANVRIGRAGAFVDNFCSGGMSASVDVKTGVVSSTAHTKAMDAYSVHPDTQCPILGYQIPEWEKVLELVKNGAKKLPGLRYIGWDVAIKKDGTVCLIEGNHNAGSDVHQVAAGKGLRSVYEEFLGKWD